MIRYDPHTHHRRSVRFPGYDYASPGAYFVTICVHGGECLLGEVADGQMRMNRLGQMVQSAWQAIPAHSSHVRLDAFVIMPNHIHGIVVINRRGEASPATASSATQAAMSDNHTSTQPIRGDASPLPSTQPDPGDASPLRGPPAGSLGAIVANLKSVTTRRFNRLRGTPGVPLWQRNYWEHIVRDEVAAHRIRAYIQTNPARWEEDKLRPGALPNPFKHEP